MGRKKVKKEAVCKFFLSGECQRGDACWFSHERAGSDNAWAAAGVTESDQDLVPDNGEYDDGEDIPHGARYTLKTIPTELRKFYKSRYSLFMRFDEGVWLSDEMWYSVTPEEIARTIAEHVYNNCQPSVVLDAFCGAGGNAIQFAMLVDKVIAIDIDPENLRCARHNAEIYGVADKIEFILGDFFDYAPTIEADVVFLSPPWGGPSYLDQEVYDLNAMAPHNLKTIMDAGRLVSPHIAAYLPRNCDIRQLQDVALGDDRDDDTCVVSYLHQKNKCIAICAYFGALAVPGSNNYEILNVSAGQKL